VIENIHHGRNLIALIVRSSYMKPGVTFFTPSNFSQQLALMCHPSGALIKPHRHNPMRRDVYYTQEVLIIRKGSLRVDFYDDECAYLESRVIHEGDIILIASGGHGFEVIEDLEMIEIKQGPFIGEIDKHHFPGVCPGEITLNNEESHGE
jgi:hypothetical protein